MRSSLVVTVVLLGLPACFGGFTYEEPDPRDCDTRLTLYRDADGDGYGDDLDLVFSCEPRDGYAEQAGDCNDADAGQTTDCATDTGDTDTETGDTDTAETGDTETGDTDSAETGDTDSGEPDSGETGDTDSGETGETDFGGSDSGDTGDSDSADTATGDSATDTATP